MLRSTPLRLVAGVITLAPFAYLIYFMNYMESFLPSHPVSADEFDRFFRIHMTATLASFVLIGGYIIYLFRTDRVPQPKKALWAVVLFIGNMIAMPVFWYLYVRPASWPESKADL